MRHGRRSLEAPSPRETLPAGYLLNTNVLCAHHSKKHRHYEAAVEFLDNGPPSQGIPTFLSVVNLMEILSVVNLMEMDSA